tara:strand:- start:575 stop:1276 length:702 start_codon:yes stop_codon:yes gene_type:complete
MEDFTFVHIPRTGGETIGILLEVRKSHALARYRSIKIRHELVDGVSRGSLRYEPFFSFVRNPYTRLYSWYSHLRIPLYIDEIELTGLNEQSDTFRRAKGISGFERQVNFGPPDVIHSDLALKHNFNDWVKIMMSDKIKYGETHKTSRHGPLITCHEFLCDKDEKQVVNNIYYFENYNEELARLFTKLDRKDLIPKIEVTNQGKKPVPGEISEETKEMIYDHFEIDFTTFGYEK